ncbi:hypothetical protein HMPREF9554_00293 [Treponema phagedenis F0421]|nr:hypothetical protein HMPREF9554_00293 [Treponema phagedenis F0421]
MYFMRIVKKFIKKSPTRRNGGSLDFLPLIRLRVLPVYAKVSGKTSFRIEQRWAIYHRNA